MEARKSPGVTHPRPSPEKSTSAAVSSVDLAYDLASSRSDARGTWRPEPLLARSPHRDDWLSAFSLRTQPSLPLSRPGLAQVPARDGPRRSRDLRPPLERVRSSPGPCVRPPSRPGAVSAASCYGGTTVAEDSRTRSVPRPSRPRPSRRSPSSRPTSRLRPPTPTCWQSRGQEGDKPTFRTPLKGIGNGSRDVEASEGARPLRLGR